MKNFFSTLLVSGILFLYTWLILTATQVHLPDPSHPLLLYSNQTRHDIKMIYCQALRDASKSIFLSVYGISDPRILQLLSQKAKENLLIDVEYDPSASVNLKKLLPFPIHLKAPKIQGLMHKKVAVLDHEQVLLGSANLTTTSLRHHANLVLGLYSPELAAYLENPRSSSFSFQIDKQQGELFLLPEGLGLKRLLETIHQANRKIIIAMFTLTHPAIADALIQARRRGVDIAIAVDYYTAKGASKKAIASMESGGIRIYLSQGRELLHHKWAVIDDTTFAMGSANWTKAAFSKNHDFLLFLSPLSKGQLQFFNRLWKVVESESVDRMDAR